MSQVTIIDYGIKFKLLYFKPVSGMNLNILELYKKNLDLVCSGMVDRIGLSRSSITVFGEKRFVAIKNHHAAIKEVMKIVDTKNVEVIGHRVVHGGEWYSRPVKINSLVMKRIKMLCDLAPLHNPHNLTGIEACAKIMPKVPQIAVFDTAFHQTMPPEAYIYAIPYKLYTKYGIRKYGFGNRR